MYKTKTFKILAFIALFLLVIVAWVMIKDARNKNVSNTTKNTGIENPFGGSTGENDLNGSGKNTKPGNSSSGNNTVPNQVPQDDNVVIVEDNPQLRKLSASSVAGFTYVTEEREIPQTDTAPAGASIVETFDFSGYKTIKFGDKADEIVAIKTVLNRQDPSPNLVINNVYDTDMKNAVIDFQNKSGLSGDGVIGGKTYAKLNLLQGIKTFSAAKKATPIEKVLMVRYVDTASGIIYDKAARKIEDKIAKTTTSIPKIHEAFFDNTGNAIKTFSAVT
jgi:peptidoglycan hydrolase-like protein with peptidoglycan-binding domain